MTEKELKMLLEGISPVIKEYFAQETAPLKQRLTELENDMLKLRVIVLERKLDGPQAANEERE